MFEVWLKFIRMQNFVNKKNHPVLKDLIGYNLEIIFCGMAPGKLAAKLQQYYPHQRNRFWGIMREAEFIDENITSKEYKKLINHKFRLTDLVKNVSTDSIIEKTREYIIKESESKGIEPLDLILNEFEENVKETKSKDKKAII